MMVKKKKIYQRRKNFAAFKPFNNSGLQQTIEVSIYWVTHKEPQHLSIKPLSYTL